jgi:hypothetical protein
MIEVPPDGNMSITFSGAVNRSNIEKCFQIKDDQGKQIPFEFQFSTSSNSIKFLSVYLL